MTQVPLPSEIDPDYHWNLVVFVVDNRRFRVPDYRFLESDTFARMYDLRAVASDEQDTSKDPAPRIIELDDVSIEDFRNFLALLYPKTGNNSAHPKILKTNKYKWISVLGLATQWGFGELRREAISNLTDLNMSPQQRVQLAKSFNAIPWLLSGYHEFVSRPDHITHEDAQAIGWEVAVELYRLREDRLCGVACTDKTLEASFVDSFSSMRSLERDFMTEQELLTEKGLEQEKERRHQMANTTVEESNSLTCPKTGEYYRLIEERQAMIKSRLDAQERYDKEYAVEEDRIRLVGQLGRFKKNHLRARTSGRQNREHCRIAAMELQEEEWEKQDKRIKGMEEEEREWREKQEGEKAKHKMGGRALEMLQDVYAQLAESMRGRLRELKEEVERG